MYLLPWHSLSKTGSHLSTSIRWYSMGQPLSLAMIISDVTSCPEIVSVKRRMKSMIRGFPLTEALQRDRFSKNHFFSPFASVDVVRFRRNARTTGMEFSELSQFLLSVPFKNRPRFPCPVRQFIYISFEAVQRRLRFRWKAENFERVARVPCEFSRNAARRVSFSYGKILFWIAVVAF